MQLMTARLLCQVKCDMKQMQLFKGKSSSPSTSRILERSSPRTMTTTSNSNKLSMKLLIDTKARKVLFAEAEKDCVDFLFYILSLPISTVTRLLKEKGMNGSLPNLYKSVENLSDTYIQSKQNKDILLKPKSSFGTSSPLLLNDVPTRRSTSICGYKRSTLHCSYPYSKWQEECWYKPTSKLSCLAPLGGKGAEASKSGFVKGAVTYMVMDDLVVKPLSAISSITLLSKFNVKDVSVLQEQVVNFGLEEALDLLKASLESKTVLTSVFMSRVKRSKRRH